MEQVRTFLIVLPMSFLSFGYGTPEHAQIKMNKKHGVLLEYIGSITGMLSGNIGIQVEIDSTIGVRYEVTIERGTHVLTHMGLFYKFSGRDSVFYYNFLNHHSFLNDRSGTTDNDPKVVVIGNEVIDSFRCTHLQHGGSSNEITDYWMSPGLPGFSQLANALNNISAGLMAMAFSGTVFTWGGLVRMTSVYTNPKTGATQSLNLALHEANTDMDFPASDFNVPSN